MPKQEVLVHKASAIPLAKGESINQYTQRLSDAVRKYAVQKLNLTSGIDGKSGFGCYVLETYSDSAVLDVYKYAPSQPSEYKYYAVKYARDAEGAFKFENFTEVERVTTFQPKAPLSVTKSKVEKPEGWNDADPEVLPGWISKSFWAGAL